ncbi:MAG: archaeosine synthase subunit alpha [Halobacteriaceae archaeon]
MTEYFEVTGRDGAARRGELRTDPARSTPALVDDIRVEAGSLWASEASEPTADPEALTVLPHRAFPPGTDDRVMTAFETAALDLESPTAAVVSPETATDHGTDAYFLSGGPALVGHASALVEAIITTREAIPDDTALGLSGVATPANVALLAYLGVDLVDADRAVVRGTQKRYLTPDGETPLEELSELPCTCPACAAGPEAMDQDACVQHNQAVLEAELRRVRTRIRQGRLRDYVEGQVRHAPWQTAAFRRVDQEWGYLARRTPIFRDAEMNATTDDALNRPAVQRFADRVTSRYEDRLNDVPLLLVPCSARKPYSESRSHSRFQDAADYRAHLVSMTSPIGVVPTELELTYPAQQYDAAVTGEWSATELDFVARVLERYLEATTYPRIIAHVPPDGYRPAVERAAANAGVEVTYTVDDHPTDDDALAALSQSLDGERQIRVSERERATLRAIADYQFGSGAGDALLGDFEMDGRYPKLRARDGDELLATLVPQYGLLALTLAGAHRWVDTEVPTRTVEIDGFVPHGSVLAPGVRGADEDILVGDEVVVQGPEAFAIGRAAMPGGAMAEATRGIAVDVRHVEER